ncbi:hypothetical protein H0E87_024484, partial [Populus deltoides]
LKGCHGLVRGTNVNGLAQLLLVAMLLLMKAIDGVTQRLMRDATEKVMVVRLFFWLRAGEDDERGTDVGAASIGWWFGSRW